MANGLHWVRGEIELSLTRARAALEQYLEAPEESHHLEVAAEELHLVRGTVGMIQCFGAAALAEEMLQLLQELRQTAPEQNLEPFSALTGATLHLSDYVDLLAHGENDRAVVLQPGINELRLARGKPLLTEAELFAAQLRAQQDGPAEAPAEAPPRGAEAAQAMARRELGTFQTAFVQWFRGQNTDAAMARMGKIADAIAVNAAEPNLREMWAGYAVLAECLRNDLQFDSLDLKRLFGRAGQHLKKLADAGEVASGADVGDTPQQLLFHIARASRQTDRSHALITSLRIDELLPGLEQLDELRRRLRGPNTSILARVHAEIGRDFSQVKDGIDLAVRTGGGTDLAGIRERLQRLANTLGALGLPAPQQALLNQARRLETPPESAPAWMDVATSILRVEHSLEEALFRALGRHGTEPARPYAQIEAEVPHAQDLRESTRALLRESLVDLAHLKAGVDSFLKSGDSSGFGDAPRMLNEVAAGLLILDRGHASTLLRKLETYTRLATLIDGQTPQAEFERFADAISCVEVYLEALRDGLPEPGRILDDLDNYIARLDFRVAAPAPAPAPAETPAAAAEPVAAEIVPSPPAAPAPAPAPVIPAPTSAPMGEGIDPEIRDIFIEEAGEVLTELERQLPAFRRDPGNRAVLGEVRRAFHTLKGSGRMVGALRIGEFGWAIENMLNRCLEGALAVRAPVLQSVEQSVALLPGLIENLRAGGGAEDPGVAALIESATRLASTKASTEPDMLAVFREDARERLGLVRRWLEAQDPREHSFEVDNEVIRAFHTVRGSAAVIHAGGVSQLAAAFESLFNSLRLEGRTLPALALPLIADALVTLRGWIESASVVDAGVDELPSWQARIDTLLAPAAGAAVAPPPLRPTVDEAFSVQALGALQSLEQQLRAWAAQPGSNELGNTAANLGTGFADLADLASRARCEPIARVGEAVTGRLAEWRGGQAPGHDFFAALLEVIEGLYQKLDAYHEGDQLGDDAELLARVQALPRPELEAPFYMPPLEPEPPAAIDLAPFIDLPQPATGPQPIELSAAASGEFDHELLEIFGAEAEELLESMEHYLQVWRRDPHYIDAVTELKRALHTLKGSARTAGAHAIGTVAHRLEALFGEDPHSTPVSLQTPLGVGFDELHQLVGDLQRGRELDAGPALAAIDAATARVPAAAPFVTLAEPQPPAFQAEAPAAPALPDIVLEAPASWQHPAPEPAPPEVLPEAPAAELIPELLIEPLAEPASEPVIELAQEPAAEPIVFAPAPPPVAVEEAAPLPLLEVSEPEAPSPFEFTPTPAVAPVQPAAPAWQQITPAAPAAASSRQAEGGFDDEITDIFSAEATELLEQLDTGFEGWQNGDDTEPVSEVLRALHTLKGGARMAGLNTMGDAVHELETRVNALLAAGYFPDADAFTAMRGELDRLQTMHDQIRRGQADLLVNPQAAEAAAQEAAAPVPAAAPAAMTQWSPELFWKPEEDLGGFALGRKESARVSVDTLDTMLNEAGEISIYRSRLEERNTNLRIQLQEMTQTIVRVREQLRMLDIETEAQIAARGRGLGASPDQYSQDFDPLEMDRYSRMQELSRTLAESISDLSSLQSTMDEAVSESDTLLLQQSRITTEVQQGLMGTLMVPFSRQVQRLLRVVRQTAQENGRQAEAQFQGVEAELDRHVLERMTAPLEHLLRNAVVHGIEDPAERALAGKPVVGTINLRLSREGSQLLVELADDGRGLDFAAIREKAIERGLMVAEAHLSDDDLARFIFEPGFSTAKRLTQDAGRGIGMDVVASEVKQLSGTLELRSEPGKGTRFLLRLPLTLAVSQALLVGVGGDSYAIPLSSIEGIARVPRAELADYSRDDGPLFAYGGRGYRVRHLGDYVGAPHSPDADARTYTAILVRLGEGLGAAERRVALIVDNLHGNREIVSKAVGPQVSSVPGVAGATILADGRVVLILDVAALVAERARRLLLAEAAGRVEAARQEEVARETIMVVDDSVTMRRVAERLLTRNGYRVVTAKDGLDAIAMLQTETPSTVLLDIEMPRADGFEVAAFIRNNARIARVPIIMITSRSGEKHRERARSLGVDRYLIKPYQEDQLLAEVKDVRKLAGHS